MRKSRRDRVEATATRSPGERIGAERAAQEMRLPIISAHRGECGVRDLSAGERYRRAIVLGVDFVEFDVRRTLDGVLVCYHDERTPAGRRVNATTCSDLQ